MTLYKSSICSLNRVHNIFCGILMESSSYFSLKLNELFLRLEPKYCSELCTVMVCKFFLLWAFLSTIFYVFTYVYSFCAPIDRITGIYNHDELTIAWLTCECCSCIEKKTSRHFSGINESFYFSTKHFVLFILSPHNSNKDSFVPLV